MRLWRGGPPIWWILATQGHVLETRGGEPVPTVFCELQFAALTQLVEVRAPETAEGWTYHYDVEEVLVVGPGVTSVPSRLASSRRYGTTRSQNLVLVPGLVDTPETGWRFTQRVGDTTYTVLDSWKTTVIRARGAHQTIAVETWTHWDDLANDLTRLAPRLLDARKRWRYCARHGYPVGERPPRGVDLVPPVPAGELRGP